MSKITPHLWFDTQAVEAAEFYSEVFPDSRVTNVTTLHDTPSGDCDMVSFTVWGHEFMAISAGPLFEINPSISFMVNFDPATVPDAAQTLDRIWDRLIDGGQELMPLGEYPFSKKYGWVADRYGVSWQLILSDPDGDPRPTIVPSLLFTGDVCGRAAEAREFYVSVFGDAEVGLVAGYPEGSERNQAGMTMYSDFRLGDGWLVAMDSAEDHAFGFNEAVSLLINCSDQAEIDYFWERLSADPESEQCGWLKDRFGVSWQVNAAELNDMLTSGTTEQVDRVTQAFLPMKKLDLATLRAAYEPKKS
jgi:predicted 3-demethylubiquinone-9 3-methyltransferase (glyoxalase superfamily)